MKKALNLQKKRSRLVARQKDYEEICSRRTDNGKGFKRPGSMSGKK